MDTKMVSIRVPTCPLECAKLGMSDTIFRARYIREALGGSACAPAMVCYAQNRYLAHKLSSGPTPSKRDREQFRHRCRRRKLDAAAQGTGFSRRTLYRARQALSDAVSDLGTGPRDSHKRWAIAVGAPATGDTPTCECVQPPRWRSSQARRKTKTPDVQGDPEACHTG